MRPILPPVSLLDGWKHCPRCGADLERHDRMAECPNGHRFYASPQPTACALCVDDAGRLLLARRAGPPFDGAWDLPGGFCEEGEHPRDTIGRELLEETGLTVEPQEFVGVWVDTYGDEEGAPSTFNLYWTARVVGGEMEAADDVSELAWFAPDELPGEFAFHIADVVNLWLGRVAGDEHT
jgi:8-oxo-dGTP diphosphatase